MESKSTKSTKPTVKVAKPQQRVSESQKVERQAQVKKELEKQTSVKSTKKVVEKKPESTKSAKKVTKSPKSKRFWAIVVFSIIAVVAVVIALVVIKKKVAERKAYEESLIIHEERTSEYTVRQFSESVKNFDTDTLGNGSVVLTSFISKEPTLFNEDEKLESFAKWVCSHSSIVGGDSTKNLSGYDEVVSVDVTSVDWVSVAESLDSDKIHSLMSDNSVSGSDLDLSIKLPDLFSDYMISLEEVPTVSKSVDLKLVREDNEDESGYHYVVSDDASVDDILFGSDEFHSSMESFAKIVVGWTGFKTEEYTEQEEQENPEYVNWLNQLNAEIAKYPTWKNTSKCLYEPYYKRDEKNKIVKDENGNKVVNFYVLYEASSSGKKIKDSSSPYKYKYIPEPEHTIMVDVKKERQVEDPWTDKMYFPYNWIGYNYMQLNGLTARHGDGSKENPLGSNTWVVSKAVCTDGSSKSVGIEMLNWYRGSDAIQFALGKSEKNRGLDNDSIVELVVCTFRVTNLSGEPITISSDLVLVDGYGNKLSRTGTIYGLSDTATLGAGESIVLEDWATSTDMNRYQVAWGKSFDVDTPLVYFDVIDQRVK